jgi:hypothetical protein
MKEGEMQQRVFLLFLCLFTSGCLSAQIVPKDNALVHIHTITIVAIEDRPLVLTPETSEDKKAINDLMHAATRPGITGAASMRGAGASLVGSAAPLILAPNVNIRTGASALAIIGGVAMLAEAGSSGREVPGETAVIESGKEGQAWMPSAEFAKKAANTLQQAGYGDVRLFDGYIKLPISDRSITWHMENWLGPIRRWYDSEVSAVDYAAINLDNTDALLEVGILNYECAMGKLLLQVFVRLIDPRTRRVLGRARESFFPDTGSLAPLLQNDGERIKGLILDTGDGLIVKCLRDIRLLH